ncbi:MAG: hypothetical protein WBV47_08260 [Salegentibacter sp.]
METFDRSLNCFFILVLISVAAAAQNSGFRKYDVNGDKIVDRQEFNTRYADNYKEWDRNVDQNVDKDEFYGTNFDHADRDNNGKLSSDEWYAAYDNMYKDKLAKRDFGTYDTNQDGSISVFEFTDAFQGTNYYSSYDSNKDGKVDQEELNENVFKDWDDNNDGKLERDEYERHGSYSQS